MKAKGQELQVLSTTEELIAEIKAGNMVVLLDDEDRENEGDLIMAADKVTPEAINFMIRYGRGLVCLPMSGQMCDRLKLPMMVPTDCNGTQYHTNFTVSIEAAVGVTTGISTFDRAKTIHTAIAGDAKAQDIVMPGHVFPLRAVDGGVLERQGHTEASVELARLAGCSSAGVLVEIIGDDGNMARRDELFDYAKAHGLKIGTVADLVEYCERLKQSA
ncbi:3,4-dihydroxy-2-butanone-4-phosphate synthase [Piscirickettsia salmonis]|nr:hypothetical protein AWJ11_11085 [Piscirickettsia salmonis]AOS35317.1 hypothetical protein AVM72_08215 [Piscirickettsia salmonis]APS63252.1 hypothetical protein AVI54_05115 [Piscirickettsia salmonis]APS67020.1 hypothetical protein AVI55_08205 [Piscirickettsia salmonis]APS70354.1 hypothetical protein AVI56_08530 [Piscirickettsia salmonis]